MTVSGPYLHNDRNTADRMARSVPVCTAEHDISHEVILLRSRDRTELQQRWQSVFGKLPPSHLSKPFMAKALAWDLQAHACGGLSPRIKRALKTAIRPNATKRPAMFRGTRLIREWNGVPHDVEVLDDGYLWQGQRYRSLSAIARAITGTRWSGPRFFGVKVN